MQVELVSVQTSDDVRLDGALRRTGGASPSRLGLDLVIFFHGVGGNFYGRSFIEAIGDELITQGCAFLRVNSRGHDLAFNSPRGRLGAAFEVVDDCRYDIKAWLDFAEGAGYRRVALWGHSLGAVKTILYLATEDDARVPCAIASSPPRFSYEAYMAMEGAERFEADYERAKALIEKGEPDTVFPVSIPTSVLLAARTHIDKYGPSDRYDILTHLPNVKVPILVTIGGEEGLGPQSSDWFPFGGLAEKVAALTSTTSNLSFDLVEGANHAYAGKVGELWEISKRWIDSVQPALAAR